MVVVAGGSLDSVVQRRAAGKKPLPRDERYFHCGVWPGGQNASRHKDGSVRETAEEYLRNPC